MTSLFYVLILCVLHAGERGHGRRVPLILCLTSSVTEEQQKRSPPFRGEGCSSLVFFFLWVCCGWKKKIAVQQAVPPWLQS